MAAGVTALPDGLTVRPATLEDAGAVTGIMAACELDADGDVLSLEDVRAEWARPSFDLAADSVVVLDGARPVAYADLPEGRRTWAYVHPDHRGRGIGTWLVGWVEERAHERGRRRLEQTVSDADAGAADLLQAHGYAVRWHTWVFRMPLDEEPPEPALPPVIALRTFEPGRDDRDLYELIETAFAEWPDRDAGPGFEDWAATTIHRPDADPALTLVLEDRGELVGAAFCLVYGNDGWVDQLAIKRSHRGRGLGRALLHASFREFRRRGLAAAALATESRTGARGLYEHVGMRVTRSYTRLSKQLA
jgi:mycothiol synthase